MTQTTTAPSDEWLFSLQLTEQSRSGIPALIEYQGVNDAEPRHRAVVIYSVRFSEQESADYLEAIDITSGQLRRFRADRVCWPIHVDGQGPIREIAALRPLFRKMDPLSAG